MEESQVQYTIALSVLWFRRFLCQRLLELEAPSRLFFLGLLLWENLSGSCGIGETHF